MHAQQQNDRELNDRHVQLFLDYSAFTVQEKTKKNSRWNNKVSNFISLTLSLHYQQQNVHATDMQK